jgi:hypothetical protein
MGPDGSPESNGQPPKPPFSKVLRAAWKYAGIFKSRHAFTVWGVYLSHANSVSDLAWISKATVAAEAGINRRQVRLAVAELAACAWLEYRRLDKNNVVVYWVQRDPPQPPSNRKPRAIHRLGLQQPSLSPKLGLPRSQARSPAASNPKRSEEKIKNKICAEAAPVVQKSTPLDQDRPPGSGAPSAQEAVEGKDREKTKRTGRQELAYQCVHGSKSDLWSAISQAGIRLIGRDRFSMIAQEEQTRQAVAYLLEQGRLRQWPDDPAAFLVWAWSHVGGRGAESLSQLRKAGIKPRPRVEPQSLLATMDGMHQPDDDAKEAEARRIQQEQEQRLADEIRRQAIKRPWTQAERDLQAKLDAERAAAKQAASGA